MTMPRPHELFSIWRADQVAECLEGVPERLYLMLWTKIVPMQGNVIANDGSWSLSSYWDNLQPMEARLLNALAWKFSGDQAWLEGQR